MSTNNTTKTTPLQPEASTPTPVAPTEAIRRRSSLFQTLYDQHHHPTLVERRESISDQHRTPGFLGKMWQSYIHGAPDAVHTHK